MRRIEAPDNAEALPKVSTRMAEGKAAIRRQMEVIVEADFHRA